MKRYLLIVSLALGIQVLAQTPPEPTLPKFTPPTIVSTRFVGNYPNVDPVWTSAEDEVYSAEYRVEETNMGRIVRYDQNGNLLSVENELHNDVYPAAIGAYYVKHYPREKYAIWSYEDAKGNKKYYAKREKETIWFDRDGKYIPVKGKTTRSRSSASVSNGYDQQLTDTDVQQEQ